MKFFLSKSIVFSFAFFSFFQSYSSSYANDDSFHVSDSERKSLELNYLLEHMVAMSDQMADLMCRVQQLEQDNEKGKERCQTLEDQNKTLIEKCTSMERQTLNLAKKCASLEIENQKLVDKCASLVKEMDHYKKENQHNIDKINIDQERIFDFVKEQKEINSNSDENRNSLAKQLTAALEELNDYKFKNGENIKEINEAFNTIQDLLTSLKENITAADQKIDRNWVHHEGRCNANHQYTAEIHAHADRIHNHHLAMFEKTKRAVNNISTYLLGLPFID